MRNAGPGMRRHTLCPAVTEMCCSATGTHKGKVTKATVLVRVLQRTNPKTGSQQAGYPEEPMM